MHDIVHVCLYVILTWHNVVHILSYLFTLACLHTSLCIVISILCIIFHAICRMENKAKNHAKYSLKEDLFWKLDLSQSDQIYFQFIAISESDSNAFSSSRSAWNEKLVLSCNFILWVNRNIATFICSVLKEHHNWGKSSVHISEKILQVFFGTFSFVQMVSMEN